MRDIEVQEMVQGRASHFESLTGGGSQSPLGGDHALSLVHEAVGLPTRGTGVGLAIQRGVKRLLDISAATCGLILISPLLLIIALLIRIDSSGPALFKQTRIGRGGRPFDFYKFRSMTDGCDAALHRDHVEKLIHGELNDDDRGPDGSFKLECDPRVTRVGRFIRCTSVDELPQLINVVKGDMSLIGPRPPLPYEVELYSQWDMRRLEVLPGMTGLWQVSGRTRLSHEEMVSLDVTYVDNWSLAMDARILLKTPGAVFGRDGAG